MASELGDIYAAVPPFNLAGQKCSHAEAMDDFASRADAMTQEERADQGRHLFQWIVKRRRL